jgi:hypothetical protein
MGCAEGRSPSPGKELFSTLLEGELTHNKCYRRVYRCVRIKVTRRWHDETQRKGIRSID